MNFLAAPVTIDRLRDALQHPLPGLLAQMQMAPAPRPGTTQVSVVGQDCRRAGVLVWLYPCDGDLCLVLTRRAESVEHHRGQMSLPGGGIHAGESAQEAALRETDEELGAAPSALDLLGELTPLYVPPSGFCVYPFVACTGTRPTFAPSPHEVAEIIEAPLSRLLDPATRHEEMWPWQDTSRNVPFYAIGENKVWGATAMILCELLTLIGGTHESDHSA
jgi:8-oxo-dGTP pyrophosphatase MutT (NUDIX family)